MPVAQLVKQGERSTTLARRGPPTEECDPPELCTGLGEVVVVEGEVQTYTEVLSARGWRKNLGQKDSLSEKTRVGSGWTPMKQKDPPLPCRSGSIWRVLLLGGGATPLMGASGAKASAT